MQQLREQLVAAIKSGNVKEVKKTLAEKVNVNNDDKKSRLPLDYVCKLAETKLESAKEITEILIKNGLNPLECNKKGYYPLARFLKKGHHQIIHQLFVKIKEDLKENKEEVSSVIISTQNGLRMPLAFYVITRGDRKALEIFFSVFGEQSSLLKEKFQDKSLFLYAISEGRFDNVFYLLEKQKANVNEVVDSGKSAFHLLLEHNNKEVTQRFISEFKPDLAYKDQYGRSYIHYIAEKGLNRVVDLVLDQKTVNPNEIDLESNTPLHIGLKKLIEFQDNFEDIEIDLDDSSDSEPDLSSNSDEEVEEDESNFKTISDEVRQRYIIPVIKKFLARGISVDSKNTEDETPLSLVSKLKYSDLEYIFNHVKIRSMEEKFTKILSNYREENSIIADKIELLLNYIKKQYEINVGTFCDSSLNKESLHDLIKWLEGEKILSYDLVEVYELAIKIKTRKYGYLQEITERFDGRYLESKNAADYCYTFLDNRLYRLTKSTDKIDVIIHKLITTLTYNGIRQDWKSNYCQLHHSLVRKLDNKFKNYKLGESTGNKKKSDAQSYCHYIQEAEQKNSDYFGECLSENSDSEDEETHKKSPHRNKMLFYNYYKDILDRSQYEKLFVNRKTNNSNKNEKMIGEEKTPKEFKKLKEFKRIDPEKYLSLGYERSERQKISRAKPLADSVTRDLNLLNQLVWTDKLNEESLKKLDTKFYVAQYRGINYRIDEWGKSGRILHRKTREEKQPLFSRSVLEKSGYKNFTQYFLEKQQDEEVGEKIDENLTDVAINTQDQMLQLQRSGQVTVKVFKTKEPIVFENALHALQNIYTFNYEQFHGFLKNYIEKYVKSNNISNIESFEDAIALSINSLYSPWVSTSDTPEHALRYAYGDKYYEGSGGTRLRPRWNKVGRSERPYLGKIYVSLHEPFELISTSHHVPSLTVVGKIGVDKLINAERETSFFAYIPGKKVMGQYIAKYPSFHNAYKEIYLEKYGLNKFLYDKFRDQIKSSTPHSIERERITRLLTAHLMSFHEICLIEEARIAAEKNGGVLIYRDERGGFSFSPCVINDKEITEAAKEKNKETKALKNIRVSDTIENGFLFQLIKDYHIVPLKPHTVKIKNVAPTLVAVLDWLGISANELQKLPLDQMAEHKINPEKIFIYKKDKKVIDSFMHDYHFLMIVAQHAKVKFVIHNPDIRDEYSIVVGSNEFTKEIHLYYLGGNEFSALKQKKSSTSGASSFSAMLESDGDVAMAIADQSGASAGFFSPHFSGEQKSESRKRARDQGSLGDADMKQPGSSKKVKKSH